LLLPLAVVDKMDPVISIRSQVELVVALLAEMDLVLYSPTLEDQEVRKLPEERAALLGVVANLDKRVPSVKEEMVEVI
jgi:hypothetical protein